MTYFSSILLIVQESNVTPAQPISVKTSNGSVEPMDQSEAITTSTGNNGNQISTNSSVQSNKTNLTNSLQSDLTSNPTIATSTVSPAITTSAEPATATAI